MLKSIIWLVLLTLLSILDVCAYKLMNIQQITLQNPAHKLFLSQNSSTLIIVTSQKDLQIYEITQTDCPQYSMQHMQNFGGNQDYLDSCDFKLQNKGQLFVQYCPNSDISIYRLAENVPVLLQTLRNHSYRWLMIDQDFTSFIVCQYHEKNFTVYLKNGESFTFQGNISSEMVMQAVSTRNLQYLATNELYLIENSQRAHSTPDFVSYNKIYHRKNSTEFQVIYEQPSGNITFKYIFMKQNGQIYVISSDDKIIEIQNSILHYIDISFNGTIIDCYQIENSVLVIGTAYSVYFLNQSNFFRLDMYEFHEEMTKIVITDEFLVTEINQSKLEILALSYLEACQTCLFPNYQQCFWVWIVAALGVAFGLFLIAMLVINIHKLMKRNSRKKKFEEKTKGEQTKEQIEPKKQQSRIQLQFLEKFGQKLSNFDYAH